MADIYLARDANQRAVAVKVLNHNLANDPEACGLFLHEARLLELLSHRSLATVFEVDVHDGVHYLAMEYVHGADLRELMLAANRAQHRVPYAAAIAIVAAAAAGLDHAHRRCGKDGKPLHLVHRDVSLSNIMIGHDGSVKVIDFGIASSNQSTVHTQPGVVRGKASYMSPEQCLGDVVDLRTDVFALGVVLYELTTGRRCFQGNTDLDRMLAVVRGDFVPPSVHVSDFPAALEAIIRIALAPDPANRFSSAAAMLEALEHLADAPSLDDGPRAIASLMHALFVDSLELPLAASVDMIAPAPTRTETATASPKTLVITRPRRFARGTDAERTVANDEEPTRGRGELHNRSAAARAAQRAHVEGMRDSARSITTTGRSATHSALRDDAAAYLD